MRKQIGFVILFLLTGFVMAVILELGKFTLTGWALFLLLMFLFAFLHRRIRNSRRGIRFLSWMGLFLFFAAVLYVSYPPVRRVPAVSAGNPRVTPVRHVEQGDLTGVYTQDGAVEVYAGIPYAKPPIGELRWKKPEPAESWSGIYPADAFAPMAMQTQNAPIMSSLMQIIGYHDYEISLKDNYREPASEDALYLNIWKPAGEIKDAPVLVYIHGGSLQTGQPWYADYSGEGLAREGIVAVNMGYRLGIFGFFADPELAAESPIGTTGNYGLLDQIMALQWVRKNIAAFGGNPDNVTLAGESAGSACVSALCTSPLAEGLFRRAVMESSTVSAPVPAHSFRSLEEAYAEAENTKERFGATDIAALRALPAEQIVGEMNTHHHITVDGAVLSCTPYEAYASGMHHEEAQLHGFNREESGPFILLSQADLEHYPQYVERLFPGEYAARVLAAYPAATDEEAKRNWADIYSAYFFSYGHYCLMRQAQKNGIPCYVYLFSKDNGRLGAWHSGEEVYFYGNIPERSGLYDSEDRQLEEQMNQYLVNFVHTGDPNDGNVPRWENSSGQYVLQELGKSVQVMDDPFLPLYEIMDDMFEWKL